jgi:hypothetical protein
MITFKIEAKIPPWTSVSGLVLQTYGEIGLLPRINQSYSLNLLKKSKRESLLKQAYSLIFLQLIISKWKKIC